MKNYLQKFLLITLISTGLSAYTQTPEESEELKKREKKERKKVGVIMDSEEPTKTKNFLSEEEEPKNFSWDALTPELGLGAGMLSFYGDVGLNRTQQPPMKSRMGWRLGMSVAMNDFLRFEAFGLVGRLYGNERSPDRNLNFESRTTTGGVTLTYNFQNFLKKDNPVLTPLLYTGLEVTKFRTFGDLRDVDAQTYYYWSDFTIRNMDENSPFSENAAIINRDYLYETNLRDLDLDGLGNYPTAAIGIPIGLGVKFQISPRTSMNMISTVHVSSSDLIDNISSNGVGERHGSPSRDKFIFTGVTFHYDLAKPSYYGKMDEGFEDIDFSPLDSADADNDGVKDLFDHCANTPEGVPVDLKGCPFDDDGDGVPNYKDLELSTPAGVVVDGDGVQLADSALIAWRNLYFDSTGVYNKDDMVDREFKVQLAELQPGEVLSPELNDLLLSIQDLETKQLPDGRTIYTVGKYKTAAEAELRRQELLPIIAQLTGTEEDVQIVQWAPIYEANIIADPLQVQMLKDSRSPFDKLDDINNPPGPFDNRPLYRIQVGAFSGKVSEDKLSGLTEIIHFPPSEDGFTRYYTGEFSNYEDAAKRKLEVRSKGFKDAFIVVFKNGKRSTVGAETTKEERDETNTALKTMEDYYDRSGLTNDGPVSKSDVSFKIQIGIYKDKVAVDVLDKLLSLRNVQQSETASGLTRYTAGSFGSYEEAKAYEAEVHAIGVPDAFVIAFYKDKLITVSEALEILR